MCPTCSVSATIWSHQKGATEIRIRFLNYKMLIHSKRFPYKIERNMRELARRVFKLTLSLHLTQTVG